MWLGGGDRIHGRLPPPSPASSHVDNSKPAICLTWITDYLVSGRQETGERPDASGLRKAERRTTLRNYQPVYFLTVRAMALTYDEVAGLPK